MKTIRLAGALFAYVSLGLLGAWSSSAAEKQSGDEKPATETKAAPPDLGSGWGTLKGSFKFRGEIPAPREIKNERDPLGPKTIVDDSLVVEPKSRGIAGVLIYLRKAPRVHPTYEATPGKEVAIKNVDCRYTPRVVASTMKDSFAVLNNDRSAHNAKGAPGAGNRDYNFLLPQVNGRMDLRFKKPTPYPYDITCAIHPWEKAWHIVRPDPYFAVTAADGTFEIKNLPTGVELEFQVWHERGAADGSGLRADPKWDERGRFKLTIPKAGETVTLDVDVDAEKFRP